MAKKQKETDSAYILKLVMYLTLGSIWVHLDIQGNVLPLPIGLGLGLLFASHDHFKIDRKIEYAVIIVAMFIGYFLNPLVSITI